MDNRAIRHGSIIKAFNYEPLCQSNSMSQPGATDVHKRLVERLMAKPQETADKEEIRMLRARVVALEDELRQAMSKLRRMCS